jgi:hypothetical protein
MANSEEQYEDVPMNRNTEQLAVSSGLVCLESATRYLEHGDFDSARALVEEGIKLTEASPRFDVLGRLRDMRTIIALKERTGRDDTVSILGRTYYIGSNAEDDQPEVGPASLPQVH